MGGLFKHKDKKSEKTKSSDIVWKTNPVFKSKAQQKERKDSQEDIFVFVNPLFKWEEEEEQKLPQGTVQTEPVQQQKLSDKQRKKLEKEQAKQREAGYKQEINTLCDWCREYEKEHPDWTQSGQVEERIQHKQYGVLLSARANQSEVVKAVVDRRMEFNKAHPSLEGGSVLTRDVTEFLGADATDEQILQTINDMNLIMRENADPTQLEEAKNRVADHFGSYYKRVATMMADSGVKPDEPFTSKEDLVCRSMKVAHIFRFVQVGNALNPILSGYVPPEQRAFISTVYEYTKEITLAATSVYSKDKTVSQRFMDKMQSGELQLGQIHDKRFEQTRINDERIKMEKVLQRADERCEQFKELDKTRSQTTREHIEEKKFGNAANTHAGMSPLARQCVTRRKEFNRIYPAYANKQSDLTRDFTEFTISGDYTMEELKEIMDNVLKLEACGTVTKDNKAAREKAGRPLLPVYNETYDSIVQIAQNMNIFSTTSPICGEAVVAQAFNVAELYRLIQVTTKMGKCMNSLIPLEKRATIQAISDYIFAYIRTANFVMNNDEESKAKFQDLINSGEFNYQVRFNRAKDALGNEDKGLGVD